MWSDWTYDLISVLTLTEFCFHSISWKMAFCLCMHIYLSLLHHKTRSSLPRSFLCSEFCFFLDVHLFTVGVWYYLWLHFIHFRFSACLLILLSLILWKSIFFLYVFSSVCRLGLVEWSKEDSVSLREAKGGILLAGVWALLIVTAVIGSALSTVVCQPENCG